MNQQSEHLSDAQIEEYGSQASGAGPETEAWVETHLDDCSLCRSRVLDFQRTQFALLPDPKVNTVSTSDCPSEDDLRDLAAGLCSEPIAQKLKAHATTCDRCRPLLQEYTEDFSDEFSPEEQAVLSQLRSASPEWQRHTARKMLKPKPSSLPVWIPYWKWVLVPAAAALIAFAVTSPIMYARRDTPDKVAKLLVQAYPEQRTTDMRWPEMAWGPSKETLGQTPENKPLSLLRADEAIQRQTPETLKKKEWLHLRAQSEILGAAPSQQLIEDLTKATQSKPASQSLMFDLAIANVRMGEVTQDGSYYERAKTVLDEILASFPPNSAALYDRAIVEERLELRGPAIADLTQAGSLEKDPAWSAEIQQKIQRLKSLR